MLNTDLKPWKWNALPWKTCLGVILALLLVFIVLGCYGNHFSLISIGDKTNTDKSETGNQTMKGGGNSMYLSLIIMLGIMTGCIMLFTELLGSSVPLLKLLPKKLLSIAIAVLVIVGYKVFTGHIWLDLIITGTISWFAANQIWEAFVNGSMFTGWTKKK